MSSAEEQGPDPGPPSLDHVQVGAPPGCEAAAREFYGGLLGLREMDKPKALRNRGGAWFALAEGGQLHIGVQEPFTPATKAHPALRLADGASLDALAARLAAADCPVTWAHELDDGRRFFTTDPWGNRIELMA